MTSANLKRDRGQILPRRRSLQSGDVTLAVYEWGEPQGTPLVFIHGYPDSHVVWHPVIAELANEHYCVAYDVRGFGRSSVPRGISSWSFKKLSQDLERVIDSVSPDKPVHLIAHDWGSIQTWESVTEPKLQSRIASFTSISGPCLDHVGKLFHKQLASGTLDGVSKVSRQVLHSWYIVLFQAPLFGPTAWKLGLDRLWPKVLARIEGVQESEPNPTQRKDGVYGVNLYRANFLSALLKPRERRSDLPVQLIVPSGDHYVTANLFEDLRRWTPNIWRRDVEAKHWLPLSHPQELALWVSDFTRFVGGAQPSAELAQARWV